MSHDQRFEDLVRTTLQDEAVRYPVTTTAAELRERAAGRRRSFRMPIKVFAGVLVSTAAIAAVVAISSLDRPAVVPPVGGSASPSGIDASPSPSGSAVPSATPQTVPFDVESGAILTVDIGGETVKVVQRLDATGAVALFQRTRADLALPDLRDADGAAVSTTGLLALPLDHDGDGTRRYSTAVIDMTVEGGIPVVVAGRQATFGPEGALVTVEQDPQTGEYLLRHFTGLPTDPTSTDLALPPYVTLDDVNGHVRFAPDGSGLFANQYDEDPEVAGRPIVLRWDGSTVSRQLTLPPFADDGVRTVGVGGERLGTGCDSGGSGAGCVTIWTAADGTTTNIELPENVFPGTVAFSSSGDAAYFTSEPDLYVVRASDQSVSLLASIGGQGDIVAITDAIYVQRALGGVIRVDFDGTVDALRLDGEFALVMP